LAKGRTTEAAPSRFVTISQPEAWNYRTKLTPEITPVKRRSQEAHERKTAIRRSALSSPVGGTSGEIQQRSFDPGAVYRPEPGAHTRVVGFLAGSSNGQVPQRPDLRTQADLNEAVPGGR
jgi:hypothetical protein